MSLPRICPSCQCIFHQDFVCTTCGAEKLRAAVTQLAYRDALEYPRRLAVAQAENARLREALEKLASVEGNGVARLALATKEQS